MRRWIASLTEWCHKPLSGGFAELDQQILKFRQLKEAYSTNVAPSRTTWCRTDPGSGLKGTL